MNFPYFPLVNIKRLGLFLYMKITMETKTKIMNFMCDGPKITRVDLPEQKRWAGVPETIACLIGQRILPVAVHVVVCTPDVMSQEINPCIREDSDL